MMMNIAIETETSDLHRLVSTAIIAANSQSVSGVERCLDVLRYLKSLNFCAKDLRRHSKPIHALQSLRNHENPKIMMEVEVLFNSWIKTLYTSGRDLSSSTFNKAIPLNLKNPADFVKVCCSELKKKKNDEHHDMKKTEFLGLKKNGDKRSQARETRETKKVDDCKSFATRHLHTQKQIHELVRDKSITTKSRLTQKKTDQDERCLTHETGEIKQNLKKPHDCKSFAAKPIQTTKKQSGLPIKLSKNPRTVAHEAEGIKQNLKKQPPPLKVSQNPKNCPAIRKNTTEMLELFEIAKKSADVANVKGLLSAKAETSICVDTLSLLITFPISSTATETRRIMERLEHLTKHKDRKICKSASDLLHHWRQSIRDQQQRDSRKTRG